MIEFEPIKVGELLVLATPVAIIVIGLTNYRLVSIETALASALASAGLQDDCESRPDMTWRGMEVVASVFYGPEHVEVGAPSTPRVPGGGGELSVDP